MNHPPLHITLELIRKDNPGDPLAFRLEDTVYQRRLEGGRVVELAPFAWRSAELIKHAYTLGAASEKADAEPAAAALGAAMNSALAPTGWASVPERLKRVADAHTAAQEGAQEAAQARAPRPVTLTVRAGAAELALLPWEQLPIEDGRRLCAIPGFSLRWCRPGASETPPRVTPEGAVSPALAEGRVLLARAIMSETVDAAEHAARLRALCDQAGRALELLPASAESVEGLTLNALERALSAPGPPVVALFLLAHGATGQGGPILKLDDGDVNPKELAERLAPFSATLRFIALQVCSSALVVPEYRMGSFAQSLHAVGVEAVLGARAPLLRTDALAVTSALARGLLVEHLDAQGAVALAREAIRDNKVGDPFCLQLWSHRQHSHPIPLRPYRGLEVYEATHASLFFGREAEVAEVLSDLAALQARGAPAMVLVAGASGTGKSSLARAGVSPKLKQEFPTQHTLRPAQAIQRLVDEGSASPAEPGTLLLIDQLEELFTDPKCRGKEDALLQALWRHAASPGCAALLTMRVDFLGRCQDVSHVSGRRFDEVAYDEAHRVLLRRMTPAQLERTITGPAERAGLSLDEGLVTQLLEAVEGEPGALPVLQFALDQLWRARRPRESLSMRAYRALGGVSGLISQRADAVIHEMSDTLRHVSRRVLLQLVALGEGGGRDVRQRRDLASLRRVIGPTEIDGDTLDEALSALSAGALVVMWSDASERPPRRWVELAHEELLRRWGTLRAWVAEDRERELERRAVQRRVDEALQDNEVLTGAWLSRAEALVSSWEGGLEAGLSAFVEASIQAREEAIEEERRRQEELQAAKDAAELEARRARDLARLALARTVSHAPAVVVSLLLAVEQPERTPGWWQAAFDVLSRPIPDVSPAPGVLRFVLSEDGSRALVIFESRCSKLVTHPGLELLHQLDYGAREAPSAQAMNPSGARWCFGWEDGTIECVEPDTGEERRWRFDGRPTSISFCDADRVAVSGPSEAGRRFAVFSFDVPELCLKLPEPLLPGDAWLGDEGRRFVARPAGSPSVLGVLGETALITMQDDLTPWQELWFVESMDLVLLMDPDKRVQAVDALTGSLRFEVERFLYWAMRSGRLYVAARGGLYTPLENGGLRCILRAASPWRAAWMHSESDRVVVMQEGAATGGLYELKANAQRESVEGLTGDIIMADFDSSVGDWVLQSRAGALYVVRGEAPRVAVEIPAPRGGVALQQWRATGGRVLGLTELGLMGDGALFGAPLRWLSPTSLSQRERVAAWSKDGSVRVGSEGVVWRGPGHQQRVRLAREWPPDGYEVSADGALLVGASRGPEGFALWRTQDGALLRTWPAEGGVAYDAALSPDARWIALLDAAGLNVEPLDGRWAPRRLASFMGGGALDFFAPERLRVRMNDGALWELEAVSGEPVLLAEQVRRHSSLPGGALVILDHEGALWRLPESSSQPGSPDRERLDAGGAEVTLLVARGEALAWADAEGGLWALRGGERLRLRDRGAEITELSFKDDHHLVLREGGPSVQDPGAAALWSLDHPGRSLVLHPRASGARGLPGGEVLVDLAGSWFPAPQQLFPAALSVASLRRQLEAAPAWPLPPDIAQLLDP